MNKRPRRTRRRPSKHFTYPAGHPLPPGWYVQWVGRTDWQPMDERTARWLQKLIVSPGDKVLCVEADGRS
jgi:hypothetical protein